MIGKIEKAHRYAQEPERLTVTSFQADFRGSHDTYTVSLTERGWHCSCHTFEAHVLDSCAHVMAVQQLLAPMLTDDARYGQPQVVVPA
jgi:site-specific recombinase XerC